MVDGVIFQIGGYGIARLWKSVLPDLARRYPMDIVILDRGGSPPLPEIEKVPFPSYQAGFNAYDSLLIESICKLRSADIFVSTYYSTPLNTPSMSVVYDMIPERLGWDLTQRVWREKELTIAHGRRHLCISQRTYCDLLEFYPELDPNAVEVAYCGVDSDVFAPTTIETQDLLKTRLGLRERFYILVGDRVHAYKNCELFFEAVRTMSDVDFDVLCVGGASELEVPIARRIPGHCRVRCAELNDADLAAAFGAAVALVYPSLYEGFGLPVIEAMACGCPVITTNSGALSEAAGDAACIIDGHSTSEMAKALRAVCVPETRKTLSRAGKRQAAKFRWSSFVDAFARNVRLIDQDAKAGTFTEFYSRWADLRRLQGEVDVSGLI